MKFDKPKIQTSHEPLVRLLAEMESLIADRAKMRMRLEGVKAEVANKLAKLEPDDEEGLKVVSAKRTQLDIFPHSIKRLDERIESCRRRWSTPRRRLRMA
jgi:predicted  nucleic acid-binding Zn-ribbon protein